MAENVFCFSSVASGKFALLPSLIQPSEPHPLSLSHCNLALCLYVCVCERTHVHDAKVGSAHLASVPISSTGGAPA